MKMAAGHEYAKGPCIADCALKVAYITAHAPFGWGETFVCEEVLALRELDVDVVMIPRNPLNYVLHGIGRKLLPKTVRLPLINLPILRAFLQGACSPQVWLVAWEILRESRTVPIALKNIAVLPKAVYVARLLRVGGVQHIHAHWGSTTSTLALVAARLTGIPWSLTLHRWDIAENNLLRLKVSEAAFTRCISQDGRRDVLAIVGAEYAGRVRMVHMGVRVPPEIPHGTRKARSEFVVACPASLVPVKGHRFLVEALSLLRDRGLSSLRCLIIGSGPLETELRDQAKALGLDSLVRFLNRMPREELLRLYDERKVDVVVLPSVVTKRGEKEGIPVALMEAMARAIPVISTRIGGIPELLSEGAGILVDPGNVGQLADAIQAILQNRRLATEIGVRGRNRVLEEFDVNRTARSLLSMMIESVEKDRYAPGELRERQL